jgi:hypothetical protein
MKFGYACLVFLGGLSLFIGSCGSLPSPSPAPVDCLEIEGQKIDAAPSRDHLQTLDGQNINLSEFIMQCRRLSPDCVLYPKFYHWKNENKHLETQTARGTVRHRVRIYYNLLSTCYPDRIDPGRTHGDVAEFYDENSVFMGLAVYMGKGLYCPLPYSGYQGINPLFDRAPQFKRRP